MLPRQRTTFFLANFVKRFGLFLLKIAPLLYHSTANFGTFGGFKLNPPLILKCGSLILGNGKVILSMLFILFIALDTASLALFILSDIVDLILLNFYEFYNYLIKFDKFDFLNK